MEFLKEIKDSEWPADLSGLKIRQASRAVLFDKSGLVPTLFVSKHNFHKLPGGGVDEGENLLQALAREVKEEAGCEIEITGEVGSILEYRSKWNLRQTSYCYFGEVITKGEPEFTEDEIEEGFQLLWLTLDEAIMRIKKDRTDNYEGWFIQQRDLAFLTKAQELLSKRHEV